MLIDEISILPLEPLKIDEVLRDFIQHLQANGTAVARWLRCCAKFGRSLVRSQLVSVEFFIDIKSFRSHYGSGVDSASNRHQY